MDNNNSKYTFKTHFITFVSQAITGVLFPYYKEINLNDLLNKDNGDWGLGIGDWGLGIGDWAQSPIPNPQSPIPILFAGNIFFFNFLFF